MSVFAKIIKGEIPAKKAYESETLIVIHDIAPAAPVHLLLIPKKPIENLQAMGPEDFGLLAEVVQVAQSLAKTHGIEQGYRLITNSGAAAGQTVFHLHFHLLGGRRLGDLC